LQELAQNCLVVSRVEIGQVGLGVGAFADVAFALLGAQRHGDGFELSAVGLVGADATDGAGRIGDGANARLVVAVEEVERAAGT
jgi:hypothetical protein